MALKLSTGLRMAMLGEVGSGITAQTTIAAVNSTSTITDSGNGLWTAGFRAGSIIEITGFTGSTLNNQITRVTSILSTGASMIVEATLVDDEAGEEVTIVEYGQSFDALFKHSVIDVYSGAMPSDADQLETGALLLHLTKDAGAFTLGYETNAFEFDDITASVLSMKAETYQDTGIVTGTAGYYVHYDNRYVTGASTTSVRMMGTVGTSSAQMLLSSTSIVLAATTTLDSYTITQPAS